MFLDNVHLMQAWLPKLERKLEIAAESSHADFRCFFSAEPINGAPQARHPCHYHCHSRCCSCQHLIPSGCCRCHCCCVPVQLEYGCLLSLDSVNMLVHGESLIDGRALDGRSAMRVIHGLKHLTDFPTARVVLPLGLCSHLKERTTTCTGEDCTGGNPAVLHKGGQ